MHGISNGKLESNSLSYLVKGYHPSKTHSKKNVLYFFFARYVNLLKVLSSKHFSLNDDAYLDYTIVL